MTAAEAKTRVRARAVRHARGGLDEPGGVAAVDRRRKSARGRSAARPAVAVLGPGGVTSTPRVMCDRSRTVQGQSTATPELARSSQRASTLTRRFQSDPTACLYVSMSRDATCRADHVRSGGAEERRFLGIEPVPDACQGLPWSWHALKAADRRGSSTRPVPNPQGRSDHLEQKGSTTPVLLSILILRQPLETTAHPPSNASVDAWATLWGQDPRHHRIA